MAEWISVDERLPEGGEWVLGYGKPWKDEPPCRLVRYDQDEKLFDDGIGHISGMTRITHWRPLPPPPL